MYARPASVITSVAPVLVSAEPATLSNRVGFQFDSNDHMSQPSAADGKSCCISPFLCAQSVEPFGLDGDVAIQRQKTIGNLSLLFYLFGHDNLQLFKFLLTERSTVRPAPPGDASPKRYLPFLD